MEPAVTAALLTIGFAIFSGLIGLAYRNLLKRVRDLEDNTSTRKNKHNGLSDKVETLWRWAFGVPSDETDSGLSGEISDGFDQIENDIEDLEKTQTTYHEVQVDKLERIITELHHADSLEDIDREDLKEGE